MWASICSPALSPTNVGGSLMEGIQSQKLQIHIGGYWRGVSPSKERRFCHFLATWLSCHQ